MNYLQVLNLVILAMASMGGGADSNFLGDAAILRMARCAAYCRGLTNDLYYFGGPYRACSIMGPQTLFPLLRLLFFFINWLCLVGTEWVSGLRF